LDEEALRLAMLNSSLPIGTLENPILVFGRDGQLGKAFQTHLQNTSWPVIFLGRSDCDLSNQTELEKILEQYQPLVIINAAAYTAVDQAENEPKVAWAINTIAPEIMANHISRRRHGVLIQYSADYVFGDTQTTPYAETDVPGPMYQLNSYGQSKLAGEQAIQQSFKLALESSNLNSSENPRYFILRTSWAYGDGDNFVRSIVDQSIKASHMKVVSDQFGVPTSTAWLAEIGLQLICLKEDSGIYHAVPDGEVSRYELAIFILKLVEKFSSKNIFSLEKLLPIKTRDYSSLANRPLNSRLNNAKLKDVLLKSSGVKNYPSWQSHVETYVAEYIKNLEKHTNLSGAMVDE
jgi:dTDP-4-dehydrorhamnose reductase